MEKDKLYLKQPYKEHKDLTVPVTVLKMPNSPTDDYIVYSPIIDNTFSIRIDELKSTPVDSEYVVDKREKVIMPLTKKMVEVIDILECIAKYDEKAPLVEKGGYFEVIQKDVKKLLE